MTIRIRITPDELANIRESMTQYDHEVDAKQVRDHYSPRSMGGDTCVGYQSDNPGVMVLELIATLAARDLALQHPDRSPADHQSTFLDHLDYLRYAATQLGAFGIDHLLNDQVWYWPDLVCDSEANRQELVQDVQAQVEAEVAKRAEELIRQGFEAGYHAAHTGVLPRPETPPPTSGGHPARGRF